MSTSQDSCGMSKSAHAMDVYEDDTDDTQHYRCRCNNAGQALHWF